jgi:Regulator of chromosome condensation (RCC1) repeat
VKVGPRLALFNDVPCVIRDAEVWCALERATRVAGTLGAKAVAASLHELCVLRDVGVVSCGQPSAALVPVEKLGRVVQLGSSQDQICAGTEHGERWCWTSSTAAARVLEGSAAWARSSCILVDASGPACAAGLGFAPVVSQTPQRPAETASSVRHSCVLAGAGVVSCVGDNTWGQLARSPFDVPRSATPSAVRGLPPVVELAASYDRSCALTARGEVWCWGRLPGAGDALRLRDWRVVPLANATELVAGADQSCALVLDDWYCWGRDLLLGPADGASSGSAVPPNDRRLPQLEPNLRGFEDLALGGGFVCSKTREGVACATARAGVSAVDPQKPVEFAVPSLVLRGPVDVLATGRTAWCAARKRNVSCYAAPLLPSAAQGQTRPAPSRLLGGRALERPVRELALSNQWVCAVTVGGELTCWKPDGGSAPSVVPGSWSRITAATTWNGEVVCGLTAGARGRTQCFDLREKRLFSVGERIKDSQLVSIYPLAFGYCSIYEQGEVECTEPNEVALATNDGLRRSAAGTSHLCLLDASGRVRCAGYDYAGQLGTDPAFTAIPVEVTVSP